MQRREERVHNQVCRYLDLQYPKVLYITDLSGIKLPTGLAVKAKKQRCKSFKIPDLIILEPRPGYHGLIIEIKKSIDEIMRKDGTIRKSEHLVEQRKSLNHLEGIGYKAVFGCGFQHCKEVIDKYMKGVG